MKKLRNDECAFSIQEIKRPEMEKDPSEVLTSWARLDRLCARFNNGLAAVAVALLIAVAIADASYIMNAINDLPPISAGGSHVLLGP